MRSGSTSNVTFWPSTSVRRPEASIAEMWTNTSLAPPSGVMKPKPLVALKNLTVPRLGHWGELLHPFRLVWFLPSAWRRWAGPGGCLAVMHWRMVEPPAKDGAVRYSQCRGKVRPKRSSSPGQQMPEHKIYRTETRWLQGSANGRSWTHSHTWHRQSGGARPVVISHSPARMVQPAGSLQTGVAFGGWNGEDRLGRILHFLRLPSSQSARTLGSEPVGMLLGDMHWSGGSREVW